MQEEFNGLAESGGHPIYLLSLRKVEFRPEEVRMNLTRHKQKLELLQAGEASMLKHFCAEPYALKKLVQLCRAPPWTSHSHRKRGRHFRIFSKRSERMQQAVDATRANRRCY